MAPHPHADDTPVSTGARRDVDSPGWQFAPWMGIVLGLLLAAGLVLANFWGDFFAGDSALRNKEALTCQYLRGIEVAQQQYHKKTDSFAASGAALNANGTLIASDLTYSFEDWQQNGDRPKPHGMLGYHFRMLQSDVAGHPVAWRKDVLASAAGMIHWAVICRAAEPGLSGEHQFLIGEDGRIFRHLEPAKESAQFKTFLLGDLAGLSDGAGGLDAEKLAAAGWSLVQ